MHVSSVSRFKASALSPSPCPVESVPSRTCMGEMPVDFGVDVQKDDFETMEISISCVGLLPV